MHWTMTHIAALVFQAWAMAHGAVFDLTSFAAAHSGIALGFAAHLAIKNRTEPGAT